MSLSADEMAALISDVRHDANNSLMAIFGYVEILLKQEGLPQSAIAKLKQIEAETRKLRDCIARTAPIRRPGA